MQKGIAIIPFLLIAIYVAVAPNQVHATLGVSPGQIEIEKVNEGTVIEKELLITRPNPKEPTLVDIEIRNVAEGMLSIEGKQKLTKELPKGKEQTPFTVTIDTTGLDPKAYVGKITITKRAKEDDVINIGVQAEVAVNVVNEEIVPVQIRDTEVTTENQKLVIKYQLENNTTKEQKIDKIAIEGKGTEVGTKINEVIPSSELGIAESFSKFSEVVSVRTNAPEGRYDLTLKYYHEGEVIKESTERVTIEHQKNKPKQDFTILIAGIGIVTISIIMSVIALRKNKK